jgi:hypothetical protein
MDLPTRPSNYLAAKADALSQVITFFKKGDGTAHLLAVFLAQIDFWHWEMENLIFSFDTFEQRARAWGKAHDLHEMVSARFAVKRQKLERAEQHRKWLQWIGLDLRSREGHDLRSRVYAPYDKLNEVLDEWNDLLFLTEQRLMPSEVRDYARKFNLQVETDLARYRFKLRESPE